MKAVIALLALASILSLGGCSKDDPEANLTNPTANKPADQSAPPPAKRNVNFGAVNKSAFGSGK